MKVPLLQSLASELMNWLNYLCNAFVFRIKLFQLGANFLSGIRLVFSSFMKQLGSKKITNQKIFLKKYGKNFYFYLSDVTDFDLLKEVFLDEEYKIEIETTPEIIFDIGCSVGASVIFFKLKFPQSKVYAFEANPYLAKRLNLNLAQFDDMHIFNIAVSDADCKREFYLHPDSNLSSSLKKRVPKQDSILVETKRLDTIIKELSVDKIDLLKFDVEGSEYDIFKSCKENKNNIKAMIGELHLDLCGCSKDEFYNLFNNCSIKEIKKSDNRYIVALKSLS